MGDEHRGGFTLTAWLVRDGRLHRDESRSTCRGRTRNSRSRGSGSRAGVEPAAKEIWRAQITSVADPLAGPEAPVAAEMLALLYDQSLDALAAHQWPGDGLLSVFRRESGATTSPFTNAAEPFNRLRGEWARRSTTCEISYRELRDPFGPPGWAARMWQGRGGAAPWR